MTGRLETFHDRPALRFERRLDHPVERVWRAISEPAELERWFVAVVEWKPETGEVFESMGQSGEVTDVEPPHLLAWTWGGEVFRFELRPERDGCRLVFLHAFDDRTLAAQHAAGWETYLCRLDFHLAGDHLSEQAAHDGIEELHERYAAAFHLDPEVGRRGMANSSGRSVTLEDGPTLRFVRRLEQPIERVWRAISEPEELRHWFPPGEELRVTESDPPFLLAGTWFGDPLRFELRREGDGCVLVLSHSFAQRDTAARDAAGWERCLARLGALLDGSPMSEAESLKSWPEAHERFAEQFGVDPEVGRRAFAQHATQT